jgi:hypothetical protein
LQNRRTNESSRADAADGSNHIFNRTIFAQTRAFWTSETLTATMLANSKIGRQIVSRAFNPNYTFTQTTEQFSLGEVAAPIIVFGDMEKGEVDRDMVEYFFGMFPRLIMTVHGWFADVLCVCIENERLPTELGWTAKTEQITQEAVLGVSLMINEAQSLITGSAEGSGSSSAHAQRGDLHSGLRF